jgi:S1-C subfamily serine protease
MMHKSLLAAFCFALLFFITGITGTANAYDHVFVTAMGKDAATAEVNARVAAVRKTLQEKASMEFLQSHGDVVRKEFLLKSADYTHAVTVTKSAGETNLVRIEAKVEIDKEKISAELKKIAPTALAAAPETPSAVPSEAAPAVTPANPAAQVPEQEPARRSESEQDRRRALATRMESSTLWIIAGNKKGAGSTGSGFIVGKGYIMTNAHVVEAAQKDGFIIVVNDTMPPTKARLVTLEHDQSSAHGSDFALLQFTPPGSLTLPVLTFSAEVRRMDHVSAWGYPGVVIEMDQGYTDILKGSTDLTPPPVVFTEGAISAIVKDKTGTSLIHTASVSPGSSGGPLINEDGQVVGINSWIRSDKGAVINAALYSPEIINFLRKNKVEPVIAEGSEKIITAELEAHAAAKTARPAVKPKEAPTTTPDKSTVTRPANISGLYKVELDLGEKHGKETFQLIFTQKGSNLTIRDSDTSLTGTYNAAEGIFKASFEKDDLYAGFSGSCGVKENNIHCLGIFATKKGDQSNKVKTTFTRIKP